MTDLSDEPGPGDDEPGPTETADIIHAVFGDRADTGEPAKQAPHSWTPVDLVGRALQPPEPPNIGGLVYPGRRHLFSGEPESLKSWAAMTLCADQIRAGRSAAYIDFEMGPRESLTRLHDLGLNDTELSQLFIYIEPNEPYYNDPEIQTDTALLLHTKNPSIIIIDAFTGALGTHKLDPNKSIDVEHFYRSVLDPLRAHGAAVVVLDHLPKDPLNRGKFAIGSERKVGATEVHLGFETITTFGRGRTGRAKITTHKDRPGYLPRPRTAELELTSTPDGITWAWHPPKQDADPESPAPFRPTMLMERVSRYLERQYEPASLKEIETNVKGRAEWVRIGLDVLVLEAYVRETSGPRNARLFERIRDFREDTDDLVPPRPDLVPDEVSDLVPPTTPPLKGGDEVTTREDDHPKQDHLVPDSDIPF